MKRWLALLLLVSVLLLSLVACGKKNAYSTLLIQLDAAGLSGVEYTEDEVAMITERLITEGVPMTGSITRAAQFMTDITSSTLAFVYIYEFSESEDAETYYARESLSWRYVGRRGNVVFYGNAEALAPLVEQ